MPAYLPNTHPCRAYISVLYNHRIIAVWHIVLLWYLGQHYTQSGLSWPDWDFYMKTGQLSAKCIYFACTSLANQSTAVCTYMRRAAPMKLGAPSSDLLPIHHLQCHVHRRFTAEHHPWSCSSKFSFRFFNLQASNLMIWPAAVTSCACSSQQRAQAVWWLNGLTACSSWKAAEQWVCLKCTATQRSGIIC